MKVQVVGRLLEAFNTMMFLKGVAPLSLHHGTCLELSILKVGEFTGPSSGPKNPLSME